MQEQSFCFGEIFAPKHHYCNSKMLLILHDARSYSRITLLRGVFPRVFSPRVQRLWNGAIACMRRACSAAQSDLRSMIIGNHIIYRITAIAPLCFLLLYNIACRSKTSIHEDKAQNWDETLRWRWMMPGGGGRLLLTTRPAAHTNVCSSILKCLWEVAATNNGLLERSSKKSSSLCMFDHYMTSSGCDYYANDFTCEKPYILMSWRLTFNGNVHRACANLGILGRDVRCAYSNHSGFATLIYACVLHDVSVWHRMHSTGCGVVHFWSRSSRAVVLPMFRRSHKVPRRKWSSLGMQSDCQ